MTLTHSAKDITFPFIYTCCSSRERSVVEDQNTTAVCNEDERAFR